MAAKGGYRPRRNSTSAERIALTAKDARAVQLRVAGLTLKQIADELEYADPSGAHAAIKRALAAAPAADVEQLRVMQEQQIDALWRIAYAGASNTGNSWPDRARCLEQCRGLLARRAKLHGLDAPVRRVVDFITRDAFLEVAQEVEAEFRELEAILADADAAGEWSGA